MTSFCVPLKHQLSVMASETGVRVEKSADGAETFVLFYGGTPYLSNFYYSQFTEGDNKFVNTEQYFHYKKAEHFGDECHQTAILRASEPRDHKRLGRKVQGYDQAEWDRVGFGYMKDGLRLKFSQNADLRKQLLSVKDAVFVEASPRDRKWGIGLGVHNDAALDRANWRGQNLLGLALTQIRDELLLAADEQHSDQTAQPSN